MGLFGKTVKVGLIDAEMNLGQVILFLYILICVSIKKL